MRWAQLIALRPRHIDFLRRTATVEETIVEVSKKCSPRGTHDHQAVPQGQRAAYVRRTPGVGGRCRRAHSRQRDRRDDLLFSTEVGTPISRNTFRTRVGLAAVEASGIDLVVRMHDLLHAHASWMLAGGADLKGVMDRMGHAQILTTQKYLHTPPEADQKNLDALSKTAGPRTHSSADEWTNGGVRAPAPRRRLGGHCHAPDGCGRS
jgi:site-specific recombinase XerD